MVAYDAIRPAAYILDPDAGPFAETYYALAFPQHWRQAFLDLCRHGKSNPDRYQQVPIKGLNAAIRALAPDLVSVAEKAALNDDKPWLYTTSEYPVSVLQSLIVSWLHTRQPSPDAYQVLTQTVEALDLEFLRWQLMSVELTEQTLTAGGTADPARHIYRLLPEVLAARIEKLPPYEYCGRQVTFRRVATADGAELMSWPPTPHIPMKKGRPLAPWHFSGTIKVTVRTVPFSPMPRIHLTTGIRRWVRGQAWPADGDAATVYLHTEGPWLAGAGESARFASAPLTVRRYGGEVKAAWAVGGPTDIMSRLSIAHDFPKPGDLAQDAEAWLYGKDGVTAVVTHHAAMGYHGVGTGFMPSERQRLTEWAGQALAPHFTPVADLSTDRRVKATPKALLKPHVPVPNENGTPEVDARIAVRKSKNEEIDVTNARLRREHLARVTGGDHVLCCHLLYQTKPVRDALIDAAEQSLGLVGYRVPAPEGTWSWQTPELEVRIHARELGVHGGPLGAGTPPRRGGQTQQAIEDRRRNVRDFLAGLPEDSRVVFVELDGKKAFRRRTTDPKFAIRLGCADAGRVSQFITPERSAGEGQEAGAQESDEEESTLEHRAAAAWADGMRQVGMNFIPRHTLAADAIPDRLNQVAFWIVRRNSDGPTWNGQFTPIAILSRPDQDCVLGRMPGVQGWIPYPDLLRRLTGQVRGTELRFADQQKTETARFIRQVLYTLRGEPTVIMTYAQNTRSRWEWLQDGRVVPDKIQFGDGPIQDLALHGGSLRLIRVRDDERQETAQWWVPKDDEHAGHSKGLWKPAGAYEGNRVFYATTAKGAAQSKAGNDDTKLTPHISQKTGKPVTNADKPAWNPTLLEITVAGCTRQDQPDAWAMCVQQQRFPDDYRNGLKLPLILHLAELATEYALPHEYKVLEEPGQDEETAGTLDTNDEGDPE
jgi:hypothetical protein